MIILKKGRPKGRLLLFEGVRVPLTPDDPSRECTAVLLPKPRNGGSRSLGRQERE